MNTKFNTKFSFLKGLQTFAPALACSLLCIVCTLSLLLITAEYGLKNSPSLQQAIVNRIQRSLLVPLQAESLALDLFPWPRVWASDIQVQVPKLGNISADRLQITPSPFALFQGKLHLTNADLIRPSLDLTLTKPSHNRDPIPIQDLIQFLSRLLPLSSSVRIDSGTLNILLPGQEKILIHSIDAELSNRQAFTLELDAQSNLVHTLSLSARIPKEEQQIQGRIKVQGLQAHSLVNALDISDLPLWPETGLINADTRFTLRGGPQLEADLKLRTKELVVCTQNAQQKVQGLTLETNIQLQEDSLYAQIHRLSLGAPDFTLSGQLAAELHDPWLQLSIRGRDLNIHPLSQTCLTLFPGSTFVNKLFGVIRAGIIPHLYISTHGGTKAKLKQQLQIQCRMVDGTLSIPKIDLLLHHAQGYAWVKGKILAGSGISACMDQARGWDGSFRYGLEDRKDRPFALSMQASAPVEYIPPILRKTVKDQRFLRELEALGQIQGQIQGELNLERTAQGIDIDIHAQKFNIQGRHQRLPWPVEATGNDLRITNRSLTLQTAEGYLGPSNVRLADAALYWGKKSRLTMQNFQGRLDLQSFWPWLQTFLLDRVGSGFLDQLGLTGRVDVHKASFNFPLSSPKKSTLAFTAHVHEVRADHPKLPQPLTLGSGQIVWDEQKSTVRNLRLDLMDGNAMVNGSLSASPLNWKTPGLELSGTAQLGPKSTQLIQDLAGIPPPFRLQGPLTLSQGTFRHKARQAYEFEGRLDFAPELQARVHVLRDATHIDIQHFDVRDAEHQGRISVQKKKTRIQAAFSGQLRPAALERIFDQTRISGKQGLISGELHMEALTSSWRLLQANGELQVTQIRIAPGLDLPELTVNSLFVSAAPDQALELDQAELSWDGRDFLAHGHLDTQDKDLPVIDLRLSTPDLDWSWIRTRFGPLNAYFSSQEQTASLPLKGRINIQIDNFHYQERTVSPLLLTWTLHGKSTWTVHSHEQTKLCSISMPGKIIYQPDTVQFSVAPSYKNHDLVPVLECLLSSRAAVTGTLNLRGHIQGTAPSVQELTSHLGGELNFQINEGRLLRFTLLSRILEILNSTEIFFGSIPDLEQEGIRFTSLQGTATMQGSQVVIDKGLLLGHSLEMGFSGHLDLKQKQVDLIVLVAPLKTVDRIIKKIPVINRLTRGNLITIPVRVSGSWEDPRVTPLSPQAVSKELVDLMRRTLEFPLKIFQPLMEHKDEKK
jgi:hypothetical protein